MMHGQPSIKMCTSC